MHGVCLGGRGTSHGVCGSQRTTMGQLAPPSRCVPQSLNWGWELGSKCLYLLSYLTGQRADTLFKYFTYWILHLQLRGRREQSKFNAAFDFRIPNKEKQQRLPFREHHWFPWVQWWQRGKAVTGALSACLIINSWQPFLEKSLQWLPRTTETCQRIIP